MRLEVNDLHVRYGRVQAVRGVSLTVEEGEVVAVLGANGAGKSSLLKALMGLEPAAEGRIILDGVDMTRWSTNRRVRQHLALVPEGRRIVTSLTVHENLLMGAFARKDYRSVNAEIAEIYSRFPNLAARRDAFASVLSGGEQQMLAIGRGLLSAPKLMMLDEPSLGLSPRLTNEVFALIAELNRSRGLAILLVEQNTHKALELAHRACVWSLAARSWRGCRPHCATILPCETPIWGAPNRASKLPDESIEPRRGARAMKSKVLGLLAATALSVITSQTLHAQEILLGNLFAGAGPFATLAKTNEIAAQMAVEEINAAGGVGGKNLKIVSFDTAGKPEQAVVGVRKLAQDDKVMAIIGPFSSGECRVAFPAGERSGVVIMSMASSAPKLAEPLLTDCVTLRTKATCSAT
jgi:branched-chain amino acid transport system ATP-binding protein